LLVIVLFGWDLVTVLPGWRTLGCDVVWRLLLREILGELDLFCRVVERGAELTLLRVLVLRVFADACLLGAEEDFAACFCF
jgi:hypothetical protein